MYSRVKRYALHSLPHEQTKVSACSWRGHDEIITVHPLKDRLSIKRHKEALQ